MSFSAEWDLSYQQAKHLSVWPWSDLITLVMRHAKPRQTGWRVLELGVGAGANIPFFLAAGAEYFGIDGSQTAIAGLQERFPGIRDQFVIADFTRDLPLPGLFDLIVDRSSITHNSEAAIRSCLDLVKRALKPGGHFIGVDWFSTAHHGATLGIQAEDSHTRANIAEGHLTGLGRVHFSDAAHLETLFEGFEIDVLEHKTLERRIPAGAGPLAWYQIVCRKRLIE